MIEHIYLVQHIRDVLCICKAYPSFVMVDTCRTHTIS